MFLDTHVLNLLFKLLHLVVSLIHCVISSSNAVVLDLVVVLVNVIDVGEFDLVVFFTVAITRVSSEAAWFNEQHDWDQNDHNNQEGETNRQHGIDVISKESSVTWGFGGPEVEDSVDHDVDNRWSGSVVTVTL